VDKYEMKLIDIEPNWRNNFNGYGTIDKYLLAKIDPGIGEVMVGEAIFYDGDNGKRCVRIRD
jgi:hypothetical protein